MEAGTTPVDLPSQIIEWRKTVQRLKEQAREYEIGMKHTREEDEKRAKELDAHEANLIGRERRLIQDKADLEKRQRRFDQLRELQG